MICRPVYRTLGLYLVSIQQKNNIPALVFAKKLAPAREAAQPTGAWLEAAHAVAAVQPQILRIRPPRPWPAGAAPVGTGLAARSGRLLPAWGWR